MEKCDCYEIRSKLNYRPNGVNVEDYSVCLGTKEQEICSCGGDKSKCNFYKNVREQGKESMELLNTAEMWLKAQEDGKTYTAKDAYYSKKTGLVSKKDFKPGRVQHLFFDDLMNEKWTVYDKKIMTKAEVEAKFHVHIIED